MEGLKATLSEIVSEHGADFEPNKRPGVPMEAYPPKRHPGAHWENPEKQSSRVKVFKRVGLKQLTPVFGTAQPPRGLSGVVKTIAYKKAETDARHWALLLLSDRIDAMEGRLGDIARRPSIWISLIAIIGLGAFVITQEVRRAEAELR